MIGGITLNIIIAISLAVNARKHFKSSILWGILGFLFGFMTVGIYLIQIGKKGLGWVILIPSTIINLFIIVIYLFLNAIGTL